MAVGVAQPFLHHAEQRQLGGGWQPALMALDLQSGGRHGLRGQPLQGRQQPQIVQHAGAQVAGKAAHPLDGPVQLRADRLGAGQMLAEQAPGEPLDLAANGDQHLRGVVVQLAGDAAPFLLLGLGEQ